MAKIDLFDYIGVSADEWGKKLREYHDGQKEIYEEQGDFDFNFDEDEDLTPEKTPRLEYVKESDNPFEIEVMDWFLNDEE